MLYEYQRQQQGLPLSEATVDEFSRRILGGPKDFSTIYDLYNLGYEYGLPLALTNGKNKVLTPDMIRQQIDAGRPVIALILYAYLTKRQRTVFGGGHFVVVVGYDDDGYILNDPGWKWIEIGPPPGMRWHVPAEEFERALNPGPNKYFSIPYQGLFYRGAVAPPVTMPIHDAIDAMGGYDQHVLDFLAYLDDNDYHISKRDESREWLEVVMTPVRKPEGQWIVESLGMDYQAWLSEKDALLERIRQNG
jgi:hypothetical protein